MSTNQQVNFNTGYNVNAGSSNYVSGQNTSNYRGTTTSNYGVNNGPIPNRGTTSSVPSQYGNNGQVGGQIGQNYTTTSYENRNTNQVNGYGQPVVNSRNTYNVEEAKGNPIANVCFGLLGLIALVSLILGILFAVGVIGNKGTDVDASVNSKGVSTNTHFRNIQHEFVEESQHNAGPGQLQVGLYIPEYSAHEILNQETNSQEDENENESEDENESEEVDESQQDTEQQSQNDH